jgi:hypothetical protein
MLGCALWAVVAVVGCSVMLAFAGLLMLASGTVNKQLCVLASVTHIRRLRPG